MINDIILKGSNMEKNTVVKVVLVSLLASGFCYAKDLETPSMIYKNHCANCHGVKADGVPKLKEQSGMSAEEAARHGTSSQEKASIYGPPLNRLSKDEMIAKLADLRNKDFDTKSHNSVMKKNITKIEEREGKITDEKMANFITKTFGTAK